MTIRIKNELLALNILSILLIGSITLFPDSIWRIIFGLPLLLFIPGYVLLSAYIPRKASLDTVERIGFSFGLSIVVTVLLGVILNFTPWGIRLYPVLIALTVFILIVSIIAWYQRKRLSEAEAPSLVFNIARPRWEVWSLTSRVLSIVLVAVVLGALGTLVYVLATPGVEERFTEFYLLGYNGEMREYPKEIVRGEQTEVIVGVINHEQKTVDYRITVLIDGEKNSDITSLVLVDGERWERAVTFSPLKAGDNQKVEFYLYRDGMNEPYLEPLRLMLDVY